MTLSRPSPKGEGENHFIDSSFERSSEATADLSVLMSAPPRAETTKRSASMTVNLLRPPRLHAKDQPANEGELMQEIHLTVAVGIVPRLPDLIPVVKLSRR